MPVSKPSVLPRWATDVSALVTTPSSGKQDVGWAVEQPPADWMNWIHLNTYKWCEWLQDIENQAITWTNSHTFQKGIVVTTTVTNGTAITGTANGTGDGVKGVSASSGAAVRGENTSSGAGVYGSSNTGRAVQGISTSDAGGHFEGAAYGSYSTTTHTANGAVEGHSSGSGGKGGRFTAVGTGSIGVMGEGYHAVWGEAKIHNAGLAYGGIFRANNTGLGITAGIGAVFGGTSRSGVFEQGVAEFHKNHPSSFSTWTAPVFCATSLPIAVAAVFCGSPDPLMLWGFNVSSISYPSGLGGPLRVTIPVSVNTTDNTSQSAIHAVVTGYSAMACYGTHPGSNYVDIVGYQPAGAGAAQDPAGYNQNLLVVIYGRQS